MTNELGPQVERLEHEVAGVAHSVGEMRGDVRALYVVARHLLEQLAELGGTVDAKIVRLLLQGGEQVPLALPTLPTFSAPPELRTKLKAAERAARYRRRKGIPARATDAPSKAAPSDASTAAASDVSASAALDTSPRARGDVSATIGVTLPDRDAGSDASRLERDGERDASRSKRDAGRDASTTCAGFTSDLDRSEGTSGHGSSSVSGLGSSARSKLIENLTGHDSRANDAAEPLPTTAELDADDPAAPPLGRSRRADRHVWLTVDRLSQRFHAERCDVCAGRFRGKACTSRLHWLGFSTLARGGKQHARFRMYDACARALGAGLTRAPRSTPDERLELVVDAFALHVRAGQPWSHFGAMAFGLVDKAIAARLAGARKAAERSSTPAPLSAAQEASAARELAERAAAARGAIGARVTPARHAPSRSIERDASRSERDAGDAPARNSGGQPSALAG